MDTKKIPKTPDECGWVCDSYELFQGHVKGKYLFAPDELVTMSKYVGIEKYYWMSVTMFPTMYLVCNTGDDFKKYSDLNNEEKEVFKEQLQDMVKSVYENQIALGYRLDEDYLEIGSRMLSKLAESDQRAKQQEEKVEVDVDNE